MIATLVLRSLRQHMVSTLVAVSSIALAVGLLLAVLVIEDQARRAFTADRLGVDAVLGARGSAVQLVLNAVFHLDVSPGNLPWALYKEVQENPGVERAVPLALGDNYKGFRIVGTMRELFDGFTFRDGGTWELEPGGRFFDETRRECVVGSFAAQQTGLRPGAILRPYHGLTFDPTHQHSEEYVVVGVLKPTNTPSDRVLWIPIEGIFRLDGHVLRGGGEEYRPESGKSIPDAHKEVSAVLLRLESPQDGFALDQLINRQGRVATLAWPVGAVMGTLFDRLGWMHSVMKAMAVLVVLIASLSMATALYNTLEARRRDLAILRALGAPRRFVFATLLAEAATISALGAVAGYGVYAVMLQGAAAVVRARTGVVLTVWDAHPALAVALPLTIVLGALCGLLPAWRGYQVEASRHLAPES